MIMTPTAPMSMAETYFLASKARTKLTREASRQDHNLRVLVSHANLLDNLMDALTKKRTAQIERPAPIETYKASFTPIPEEDEDDEYDEKDFSDDEDFDEADFDDVKAPLDTVTPNIHTHEIQVTEISDSDSDSDDDDDYDSSCSYVSTTSSVTSSDCVPSLSLSYSSEEESDDEYESSRHTPVVATEHVTKAAYLARPLAVSIV